MNILFLAPRLPLPADTGGKIRTLNILRQLAKNAALHLVCFSFNKNDKQICSDLENENIQVTLVPSRDPSFFKQAMQILLNAQPASIAKYNSKDMEQTLAHLRKIHRFDAVHFDHVHMTHYKRLFNGIPCVLDEHNVEYKILERCAKVEKSLVKRMAFRNQAQKMKRFESLKIGEIPVHLAVSSDDLKWLRELDGGKSRGCVVPNGVDTGYFQRSNTGNQNLEVEEDAVVFTGSMDWFPNNDAAVHFIQDILPIVWKKRPEIKFYIVGKGLSKKIIKCAKNDNRIICTGRVDDVRSYVEKPKVFVVPLRIGGGTRLKILEAMSMKKAVVSTTIGAEGIDYKEGENILLADHPNNFAEKIITLMDDHQKRERLGSAGRMLVLEKYDWNIVGDNLRGIYEKIKKT